jgi:hypothetical protein
VGVRVGVLAAALLAALACDEAEPDESTSTPDGGRGPGADGAGESDSDSGTSVDVRRDGGLRSDGGDGPLAICDAGCDDGVACTIDECSGATCLHTIDPNVCGERGTCSLTAGGCVQAATCGDDADCMDEDPCTRGERCNGATAVCEWNVLDSDGDGFAPLSCGGQDSDDSNADFHPGGMDVCDGEDNDSDGNVDEEPEASASCAHGTCEDGICPVGCNERDGERLFAFVAPSRFEYAVEFRPCFVAGSAPRECVSAYAEDEGIAEGCVACMVPLAECLIGCGTGVSDWTTTCTSCECTWTECAAGCVSQFEECTGMPLPSGCPGIDS